MSNNNRIAMFSIHSDPLAAIGSRDSGGQNVYVHDLAKALDKQGWAIDIFTRCDNPKKKSIVSIGKNSRVIRLEAGKPSYIYKGDLHSLFPEIYTKFKEFIDYKNPYSLFHCHHYDGGWIGVRAKREFQKPIVENFHSLGRVRQETQNKYLEKSNDTVLFNERFIMEEEIVREASTIISLAETEKENLTELYSADPEKIQVIPGGVNLQQFYPMDKKEAKHSLGFSDNGFILLFVGRLEWRKGVATLISSLKYLEGKVKDLQVVIVGGRIFDAVKNEDDTEEYKRLLSKAREEGVENKVKFIGKIDHNKINDYYAAADIFIIPSYYEPFGLVALESMAMKIPVVASRKDGLRVTIKDGETGLLFEPRNPKDLSNKILQIYNNPDLAIRMAEAARRRVEENYSWNDIAGKISDIYKVLIQ